MSLKMENSSEETILEPLFQDAITNVKAIKTNKRSSFLDPIFLTDETADHLDSPGETPESSPTKGKRLGLSLEMKQKLYGEIDSGCKRSDVAKKYGISKSTVSKMLKNRNRIETLCASTQIEPARKRLRSAQNADIEAALIKWVHMIQNRNGALTGIMLKEKARELAKNFDRHDFRCSNGWMQNFNRRHQLSFKKTTKEENPSVYAETVESFFNDNWPALVKNYAPWDTFHATETALLYNTLPDQNPPLKKMEMLRFTKHKEQLTLVVTCNTDGSEKLPLLVIGNRPKSYFFKNIKTMPLEYTCSKNAVMTPGIFTKWIKELDRKFRIERRKVCIFISDCHNHCKVPGLTAITVVFVPPPTISKLQPFGHGIVQSVKISYRGELVRKMVKCYDANEPFAIDILDALVYLRSAWKSVDPEVVKKCLRHTSLESEMKEQEPPELQMPKSVIEEAERRGLITPLVFADYVCMDDNIPVIDDEEAATNWPEEDDDNNGRMSPISMNEGEMALETLRLFLMEHDNSSLALKYLDQVDEFMKSCSINCLKEVDLKEHKKDK